MLCHVVDSHFEGDNESSLFRENDCIVKVTIFKYGTASLSNYIVLEQRGGIMPGGVDSAMLTALHSAVDVKIQAIWQPFRNEETMQKKKGTKKLPTIYTYVRSTDGLKTSNSQTKVRCDQRVEQEKERCKASFCCCMLGARWDPNVESANSVGFVGCRPL
ncbi:hypothetical protein CKAN_01603000 [Cinnamomum micranthum f. kanehirae]|uniref:Uncharacterized protein n=1 Tax=Cinnamomum micranthum f. kanehirae TaxID=337451 RepID=A0A443P8N2_9MAGN|nr:hypothetical protein CKAN_01603000 [Cinnamomum micranthum f. kanehirae]